MHGSCHGAREGPQRRREGPDDWGDGSPGAGAGEDPKRATEKTFLAVEFQEQVITCLQKKKVT